MDRFVRDRDMVRFTQATQAAQGLIERRLAYYVDSLRNLRGLHDATGGLEAATWQNYFSSIDFSSRYPGLKAIGYAERVRHGDRAKHEQVRQQQTPGYRIMGPAEAPDAYPVTFLEPPLTRPRELKGVDLLGLPQCRQAMEVARDTDAAAGTQAFALLVPEGANFSHDFAIFFPTYHNRGRDVSQERRRHAVSGYVFVLFQLDELVASALGKEAPDGVKVEVFDQPQDNSSRAAGVGNSRIPARFVADGQLNFAGQRWGVRFSSQPAFEAESLRYLPWLTLVVGLGLSLALFWIAWGQTKARVAAEQFTQDLRDAQMRYQLIERATNDAIWDWDIATGNVTWNEAVQAMFIYAKESVGSDLQWWRDRVHPDDLARIESGRHSALQTGGEFWADEYRFRRGDFTYADVIDRGYIVRNRKGTATQMIGSMVDITGRKQAEEARRRSEQRLTLHIQQTPLAVIEWNLDFEVTEWNPAAERIFGYTEAEARGRHGADLIVPANAREQVDKVWSELLQQTSRVRSDGSLFYGGRGSVNENKTKDGRVIICEWYNTPLIDRNSMVIGVASLALDVTANKRAEQALAAEKERLAVTLRSIGDGVITTDIKGCITMINKVAEGLTGWNYRAALGQPLGTVFHLYHQKTQAVIEFPIARLLETGRTGGITHNCELVAASGNRRQIDSTGAPIRDKAGNIIGAVLVFRDVTEKQAMATELLRADKLESLGILAGGIAHDFNNILTAITGNLSLIKLHTNPGDRMHARLEEAEKATLRARDLTQQLLTFAKGGAPVRKTSSINEIVRESTQFAMRGANVRCVFNLEEDLLPVDVDEGQISQVINNLAINAIQAMPEGGFLEVSTENVTLDPEENHSGTARKHVKISIRDHGTGIRPEHLAMIFDPYFTTKQKGSGLGLATSYSIVHKHDGVIKVDSKLGVGTVFHIYLPASEKRVEPVAKVADVPLNGHGRILVMDDEPLILELATAALTEIGYEVETVNDGAEAIRLYGERKSQGRPFAGVIMDLTIPGGMGGKEAMKRMLSIHPEVRAIVCSGYSNDPVMANHADFGFKGFVCKPYRVQDLAMAVKNMLEAG